MLVAVLGTLPSIADVLFYVEEALPVQYFWLFFFFLFAPLFVSFWRGVTYLVNVEGVNGCGAQTLLFFSWE